MAHYITFNKTGYDPFIDFIKAYAIICVLIGHTLPVHNLGYGLWAGMQVPLFILIQVFHFYKRDDAKLEFIKMCQRVVLPFVLFFLLQFVFLLLLGKEDCKSLILRGLMDGGGYGPGSYYPIIYVQIALLLPCFKPLFKRMGRSSLVLLFLGLAEAVELMCSAFQPPEWLYRILAVRYVFLIYLGWQWTKDGVKLNWATVALSLLSAIAIIYFEYIIPHFGINNEPWFFNTRWTYHRWPCYFFVAWGMVFVLHAIWSLVQQYSWVERSIKVLAKSSYEIFLMQMTCICIMNSINVYLPALFYVALIWILSILGGIFVHDIFCKFFKKKLLCTSK